MTAKGMQHILQAETWGVSSKMVCTASRAWCCLTYARPSAWVKACSLDRNYKKLRNLLKVSCNSRGSGKEVVWMNSGFLLMPYRSQMTANYQLQPPLEKWSRPVRAQEGNWRASPSNLSFFTTDQAHSAPSKVLTIHCGANGLVIGYSYK